MTDHDCAANFKHDQTADIVGNTRYEAGHCTTCGKQLRMVWSLDGIMTDDTGTYLWTPDENAQDAGDLNQTLTEAFRTEDSED